MEAGTTGQPGFFLPVGTVTFLLTDVEGSVRLWEADPDAASKAATRLGDLIDDAVGRRSGVRPKEQGEGDSAVAAFARASDAVACALDLQRATISEPWPGGASVRLRIGIHTGEALLRDEANYFGPAVNRCARLRSLGHGGQTLLARSTHELVVDRLPEAASLQDLGQHRLRDLGRPEHVYQLCHPDLPGEFPPLQSLDAMPNNLPVQLTSFIGREREVVQLRDLIGETRLLTLTGAGGCGKTRLAVQLAADLLDRYPDGVWLVDLAPVADPALVPKAVASALSLREEQFRGVTDVVMGHIGSRTMLLIFDNCEHVVAACAHIANILLQACPSLTLLATSREALGVPGETPWRVPSLSAPAERQRCTIETLGQYEAVQLFIDRARKARPNFAATNENAPAVAEISARLDGIPLAVELAAARVRLLTPQQVCDGLADRFRLLTGGARTALPRHQTLRASVDWSHDLLSDAERALFRRLAVFVGGFTLDAAEEVCSAEGIEVNEVLDVLSDLVDKSLVQVQEDGAAARYRMLETVRQYALDRLRAAGEETAARARHLAFYVALAERAEPELVRHRQDEWLDRLDAEHDNLRAALSYEGDADAQLRLAAALAQFWVARGHFGEGRRALDAAIAAGAEASPALRGKALLGLAWLTSFLLDVVASLVAAEQALAIIRETGDVEAMAAALSLVGYAHIHLDGRAGAQAPLEESLTLAREASSAFWTAHANYALGEMYLNAGEPGLARRHFGEAVDVARRSGDRFSVRIGTLYLGWAAAWQGDFIEAEALLEATVAESRDAGDTFNLTFGVMIIGSVLTDMGDYPAARTRCEEALELARQSENPIAEAGALTFLGYALLAAGDAVAAKAAFAEALPITERMPYAFGRASTLLGAGETETALGHAEDARHFLEEALQLSHDHGIKKVRARGLLSMGRLARLEGDPVLAEDLCHEALGLEREMSDKAWGTETLEVLAGLAAEQESFREASHLLGAAAALREATGSRMAAPARETYERDVAAVHSSLGEDEFASTWAEGAALSFEDAVVYAARGRGERKRPSTGWASLTPTEIEVVRLVREGLSNPEIAKRLFIARGTAKVHVSHIFAKLGVSSRSELAAESARRGI